ncbi:Serologically defined colon cancer antigen 3 [Oopsacas minuta]|uniref:Endosome-associated-trafficking regulator 1 n=1 Tax=Oopsacas minuta TaxID=111878 RepID=A0AAV7JJX9_9METZ|nr:Serologically defined colon cancer antigen 3 [Oopsacas minuta]
MSMDSVLDEIIREGSNITTDTLEDQISSDNPFSFQSFVCKKADPNLYQKEFDHLPESEASSKDISRLKSISTTEAANNFATPESTFNSVDNPFSYKKFIQPQYSVPKTLAALPLASTNVDYSDIFQNTQNNVFNSSDGILKPNSEDSDLKIENFSLKRQIQDLEGKNLSLSVKLQELQLKDSQETKALEQVIHNVEDHLAKANKRAILAENRFEKLNSEFSRFKRQNKHSLREFYQEQTQAISAKIRISGIEAEHLLNQMLVGVSNLKQVADLLESLHQVYEPIDSQLFSD